MAYSKVNWQYKDPTTVQKLNQMEDNSVEVTEHRIAGFELVYNDTTKVDVNPGVIEVDAVHISKTAVTTLTLATAADWWDGATDSYSGGLGWNYIGVDSSGNIKFLGENPPDKADTIGNTAGVLRYWFDSSLYWRVIGAVRVETDDTIASKFYQQGSWIFYDDARADNAVLVDGSATTWTDVDCSSFVPSFAELVTFNFQGKHSASIAEIWFRRNGSAAAESFQILSTSDTRGYVEIMTDSAQILEYIVQAATDDVSLFVYGFYIGGIR